MIEQRAGWSALILALVGSAFVLAAHHPDPAVPLDASPYDVQRPHGLAVLAEMRLDGQDNEFRHDPFAVGVSLAGEAGCCSAENPKELSPQCRDAGRLACHGAAYDRTVTDFLADRQDGGTRGTELRTVAATMLRMDQCPPPGHYLVDAFITSFHRIRPTPYPPPAVQVFGDCPGLRIESVTPDAAASNVCAQHKQDCADDPEGPCFCDARLVRVSLVVGAAGDHH